MSQLPLNSPRELPTIEPYWLWARPRLLPSLPPLPGGRHQVDVAIIGGGLAGLSVAYHLLRRHPQKRVLLLEAGTLGSGASARSTGMLSPGVGQSLPSLVRRLGPSQASALYRQTLDAVQAVTRLIDDERLDCDLHLGGQIVYAQRPSQRQRLALQARLMDRLGLADAVEILDESALAARLRIGDCVPFAAPRTAANALPAALRFPTAGVLDPLRLILGLAERVRARGGQIHEQSRVLSLETGRADGSVCLRVSNGEVIAKQVVLATAGFAPQLGVLPGRLLPVQLQALVTEPLSDATLAQLGWADRDGLLDARRLFNYFRLTADRRIVFGGGRPRYAWAGGDGTAAGLRRALAHLRREFDRVFPPALGIAPIGGWGGTIGYVLDAMPLIGPLAGQPRIVTALGWCGHGVALATACGAWVVDLLDGNPVPDLPWFRSQAPRVPTELGRFVGFAATTRLMSLQDRVGA